MIWDAGLFETQTSIKQQLKKPLQVIEKEPEEVVEETIKETKNYK